MEAGIRPYPLPSESVVHLSTNGGVRVGVMSLKIGANSRAKAYSMRSYAGRVRNSTYSPTVILSKSCAPSSYFPARQASSPR